MPPRASRRGGGWQQRAGARAADAEVTHSLLAYELTCQALLGVISPQQARLYASLAKQDIETARGRGPEFEFIDLNNLSKLGTDGQYGNKVYGDLMSSLAPSHFAPYKAKLPMMLHPDSPPLKYEQSILLPHETFNTLYNFYPHEFKKRMCPSNDVCYSFWDKMAGCPILDGHPVHARTDLPCDWRYLAVPWSMHGDGVPCVGVGKTWSKSMELLSWASCLVAGTTIGTFLYVRIICTLYLDAFRHGYRL